jgi:hypothetical protein
LLNAKITSRPDRQQLIATHILADSNVSPALVARQQKLKRAQLADDLNERLSHRPGPLELIKGNILKAPSDNAEQAVRLGHVQFKPTSAGQPVKHPTPCFLHSSRRSGEPYSIESLSHHHHLTADPHLHHHHPHHLSHRHHHTHHHLQRHDHDHLHQQTLTHVQTYDPNLINESDRSGGTNCACGPNRLQELFGTSQPSPIKGDLVDTNDEEDEDDREDDREDDDDEDEPEAGKDANESSVKIKTEDDDDNYMDEIESACATISCTTNLSKESVRPEVMGLVAGSPGKLAAAVSQAQKRHARRLGSQSKLNLKSQFIKSKTIKFHEYKVRLIL